MSSLTENLKEQEAYWNDRWMSDQTGWHLSHPHDMLVRYIDLIAPNHDTPSESTIFVPLSGKTRDISWLHLRGYSVAACELSPTAVIATFDEMFVNYHISQVKLRSGKIVNVYENDDHTIRVFQCNIFDLEEGFSPVTAIFDRAALVALPPDTREKYTRHLLKITHMAPQLLVTFEHDQGSGPPHSVPEDLVKQYYSSHYTIELWNRRSAGSSNSIMEATYYLGH